MSNLNIDEGAQKSLCAVAIELDTDVYELVQIVAAYVSISIETYVALGLGAQLVRDFGRLNIPHELLPSTIALNVGLKKLSHRELQVLGMVASGLTNKEIASKLDPTVWTINDHVKAILAKLDVKGRTEAAVYAAKLGLV